MANTDFIVCSFMENSIALKSVNAGQVYLYWNLIIRTRYIANIGCVHQVMLYTGDLPSNNTSGNFIFC